jgi:hypothetical protein
MIVEQLRCGGVLEAVRVSRAGYPIRETHDVFKARYNFLGDRENRSNKALRTNTPYGKKLNTVHGDSSVKNLIGKIALDIWEADQKSKGQLESNAQVEVSCGFTFDLTSFHTFALTTTVCGESPFNILYHRCKHVPAQWLANQASFHHDQHFCQNQKERTPSKKMKYAKQMHFTLDPSVNSRHRNSLL